jgi:hypothetical protein
MKRNKIETSQLEVVFKVNIDILDRTVTVVFTKYHPGCAFGETWYAFDTIFVMAQAGFESTFYHEIAHLVSWWHYSEKFPYTQDQELIMQFGALMGLVCSSFEVQDVLARMRAHWPDSIHTGPPVEEHMYDRVPKPPIRIPTPMTPKPACPDCDLGFLHEGQEAGKRIAYCPNCLTKFGSVEQALKDVEG